MSMNTLEAEYSFLAPTWKLPPVATPSMYPLREPIEPPSDADWTTWNNTRRNAGYIPTAIDRRAPPPPPNKMPNEKFHRSVEDFSTSFDPDEFRYVPPAPAKRRVKIIDHRQTPSSDQQSGRESHNSYVPPVPSHKSKSKSDQHSSPIKSKTNPEPHSAHSNGSRSTNGKIHEQLYAQATHDPGSYVNSYKNQQRRLQTTKSEKAVMHDYKNFVQNGGFGPTFGGTDPQTYEEKLNFDRKRKDYSKQVREVNQYKIEEHRRYQINGGQRAPPRSNRKYHSSEPPRSHFLSAQEVREFERRIKREHDANCRCSLHNQSYLTSA